MKNKIFNIPNILTFSRVILGFVFLILFIMIKINTYSHSTLLIIQIISFVIFVVAIITDGLDGWSARKLNQVTDLGKHFDPLADSMFFIIVFLTFVIIRLMPWYFLAIIVLREGFMHIYFRPHVKSKGTYLAANIYGKVKTFFQAIFSMLILLMLIIKEVMIIKGIEKIITTRLGVAITISSFIFFAIIVFLSVMSQIIYIAQYIKAQKEKS